MSDASVHSALRSDARLVVVEAPAGCGKTYQGAEFAADALPQLGQGRLLVLAHTHAAVDVFASRTSRLGSRIDVRTIDSLIAEVAAAYNSSLGLPPDPGVWVRSRKDGYQQLAALVARLVKGSPMIAEALARRYPLIVCDEHQDSSEDQHAIVLALQKGGAALRIFGDPMQHIFGSARQRADDSDIARWEELKRGGRFEELDYPHRWSGGAEALGSWILECRQALKDGGVVDLSKVPPLQVRVIFADNQAPRRGAFQTSHVEARELRRLMTAGDLLVLSRHNETVTGLRAFYGRRVPVWEGHTRDALEALVSRLSEANGDASAVAEGIVEFLGGVGVGFSPTAFGDRFKAEVANGCGRSARGMPAKLQDLARMVLAEPNHKGASKVLAQVRRLARDDAAFEAVKIDHGREYMEAVGLGGFDDLLQGFGELTLRRTRARPPLPEKAISTVHKAKGFERDNVLVVPCDRTHFGDSRASRCAFYVAISRAKRNLTLVVSRNSPSPLFQL
ncbi:UvrD-helicase domain-containing protein [Alsobacter sp. R-9]